MAKEKDLLRQQAEARSDLAKSKERRGSVADADTKVTVENLDLAIAV